MGFSADLFLQQLQTTRLGRACRVLAETGSTIDVAWQWLHVGAPEGALVIADRQTRARGRLGREWASPDGGLWMSVIGRPDLPVTQAGRLGVAMALAASEAVWQASGAPAKVKWPNDILLDGRKVAGVLVETKVAGDQVEAAVLSLGLNVNVSLDDLPQALRSGATSVRAATGRDHPLEAMAARVLGNLERIWPFVLGDGSGLVERWRERDALSGVDVEVEVGGAELRGRASGIDAEGALVLLGEGMARSVSAGEVVAVKVAEQC